MDELKKAFCHIWDKAYQCNLLKNDIEKRYPYLMVLGGHEAGAPDLYIYHNQRLICAIEVTGSDKVSKPWQVWLNKSKIDFARRQKYPIGFFLFFGKDNDDKLFSTMDELRSVLDPPEVKTTHGFNFEYHILDRIYFKGELGFWSWLEYQIETRTESLYNDQ